MSFLTLKEEIRGVTGREYFTINDICQILLNLGKFVGVQAVNAHLKNHRIYPQDYGISPFKHGILHGKITLYSEEVVWNYLKKLEKKKQIRLAQFNIRSIEDIIDNGLHEEISYEHYGLNKIKEEEVISALDYDPDEYDGSFENVVRAYEEN